MTEKELSQPHVCYWLTQDGTKWMQTQEVNHNRYQNRYSAQPTPTASDLQGQFAKFDANQDGILTFEELLEGFRKEEEERLNKERQDSALAQPVSEEFMGPLGSSTNLYSQPMRRNTPPFHPSPGVALFTALRSVPVTLTESNTTPRSLTVPSPRSRRNSPKIGRAVQQECRDRSRMPSSA
eukprot:TRINITY_DN36131_c0_g2_i2.p1 TRINITY_DN36131_c0_g2~~TRINITY_DN36131_c0_g2_i2.p1  ORF type:complete len:197 (-),score=26.87 TRINITY_DN36131_c0_g2_i2:16-558(-)